MFTFIGISLVLAAITGFILYRIGRNNKKENLEYQRNNYDKEPEFSWMSMNKIISLAIIGIIFFLFGTSITINDAGERQVVQTLSGELWVRFDPGLYVSGFGSKVTTYPNNVTVQVGPEEKKSDEADYWEPVHTATFGEGDQAEVGHTVKWDLPNNEPTMKELHTTYNNIDNLMKTTLLQYQKETMNYSTQRLSSEAHYSGGQSQLKEYFQDQLRNGQVLLITETKTRKLEDGTEKTYIQVQEKIDENGNFLRTQSDIQTYGMLASFSSIDYVKYDARIYEKLKDKIDAASDEATAKQKLITAQQEALTVKAQGEKLIAETQAREQADKLQAVIRAEKEAAVAAENLKRDELKAKSDLAIKRANAEGDRLKVAAGLTPLEKATIEKETRIGVAKALAGPNGIVFPSIVSGGGSNNGSGALQTFELERLYELSSKMGNK